MTDCREGCRRTFLGRTHDVFVWLHAPTYVSQRRGRPAGYLMAIRGTQTCQSCRLLALRLSQFFSALLQVTSHVACYYGSDGVDGTIWSWTPCRG